MATLYTYKCPHCNGVVWRGYSGSNSAKFGSPFQTCQHCGYQFIDKSFRELALEQDNDVFLSILKASLGRGGFWILVIFIVFAFVKKGSLGVVILPIIGVVLFYLWGLFLYNQDNPKDDPSYQQELAASKQRLSDPEYAKSLSELGYKVPDKYLNPNK